MHISCERATQPWLKYFRLCLKTNTRSTKEKAKCAGIHAKNYLSCVEEALETLKALSLFPQRRDATAITEKEKLTLR